MKTKLYKSTDYTSKKWASTTNANINIKNAKNIPVTSRKSDNFSKLSLYKVKIANFDNF